MAANHTCVHVVYALHKRRFGGYYNFISFNRIHIRDLCAHDVCTIGLLADVGNFYFRFIEYLIHVIGQAYIFKLSYPLDCYNVGKYVFRKIFVFKRKNFSRVSNHVVHVFE